MQKNKKLALALPVLLGIAVCVWRPNFQLSASKSRFTPNKTEINAINDVDVVALVKEFTRKDPINPELIWGERNPFRNILLKKTSIEDKKNTQAIKTKQVVKEIPKNKNVVNYYLKGIVWNETKPSVIINDLVLYVGSKIDLFTVMEIRADEVVLSDGTKENVIKLRKD